jgi:hypothetical protein
MAGCKFYFPSDAAAVSFTPAAIHTDWTRSVSIYRRIPVRDTKTNSANADQSVTDAGTNPSQECRQQWVFGPLAAQTIGAQNIGIGFMAHHGSSWGFHWLRACVYVQKGDNSGRRGTCATIAQLYDNTNSFPQNAPYSSRYVETGVNASTSVVVTAGDYLVIEVGYENQSGSSMTTFFQLGDGNASDIVAADEATTTNKNANVIFDEDTVLLQAPSSLTYTNSGQSIRKNVAMTNMVPSNSGGPISSYAILSGALPAGVNISSTTGIISGTPTVSGSYTWVVRGTGDGGATTDSGSLTMTVQNGASTWTLDMEM